MASLNTGSLNAYMLQNVEAGFYLATTHEGWLSCITNPTQKGWLWAADTKSLPLACPISTPSITINVFVYFPTPVAWAPGGTIQPIKGTKVPGFTITYKGLMDDSILWDPSQWIAFQVTIQRDQTNDVTPWSINQSISWTLYPAGGDPVDLPGVGVLEIYGIIDQQPKFIQNDGIPSELLRLFIPPSLTTSIQTEAQWIEWVARVCHGTQDPTAPFGTLRTFSTPHWLRYQVWTGGPSFISENGHKFNLSAWIDAYVNFKGNPDWLTTVNCFDQAGIVEIALGLGISNSRLRWEVKKPFGFIKADLVGWGTTNNPFFEGDTAIQNTTSDDPIRSPFRSHVFISISPSSTYDRANAVIVDACAGPVYGNFGYAQYLTECALQNGQLLLLEDVTDEDATLVGVDGSDGTQESSTLTQLLHSQYGGIPENINSALVEIRSSFSGDVSDSFTAETAINSVMGPILSNTAVSKGAVFTEVSKNPITTTTDTDAGSVTSERKFVAIVQGSNYTDPTFVSFQVSVFEGGVQSAVNGLQSRLKLFTVPMDWAGRNKINMKESLSAAKTGPKVQVFGNNHLSLFVYKNLLVSISGNAVMAYIPTWTKTMVDQLGQY